MVTEHTGSVAQAAFSQHSQLTKPMGVTPSNMDETVDDGCALSDLEPKQKEQPQTSTQEIDLPEDTTDEVTLPEMHNDPGNDLLTADFLDTDNATLLGIDAALVPDFVKEMLIEQGIDWNLEFKLLTFLEQQNIEENTDKQEKKCKK